MGRTASDPLRTPRPGRGPVNATLLSAHTSRRRPTHGFRPAWQRVCDSGSPLTRSRKGVLRTTHRRVQHLGSFFCRVVNTEQTHLSSRAISAVLGCWEEMSVGAKPARGRWGARAGHAEYHH